MYSIIDIEATGGNASNGKITEIAIYRFNGNEIVDQFESLINPEQRIPHFVQRLTGITNKMTDQAPTFSAIAPKVLELTEGSCFVAHNVKADYNFIKSEMQAAGYHYQSHRLCTLELSKKLIPDASSHGLEKICRHLGISLNGSHRAAADALATVELFKHLQQIDQTDLIQKLIRKP